MGKVDMVFYGGRIATLNKRHEMVEALALKGEKIITVGSTAHCLGLADSATMTIDLGGRFVMPGINDSHCHPDAQAAKQGRWQDLALLDAGRQGLLDSIALFHRSAAPDQWYLGFRFDERSTDGYPSLQELDSAAPGRQVFILRRDAQVALANNLAILSFKQSGRVSTLSSTCLNEQTGMLKGPGVFAFMGLVNSHERLTDYISGFPKVFEEISQLGITSIHNALTSDLASQAYQHLRDNGELPIRAGLMLNGRDQKLVDRVIDAGMKFGAGDHRLHLLGVEYGSDGSTSGRTAAYYEPYIGEEGTDSSLPNRGAVNFLADELAEKATKIMRAGLQVAATGNGDRGIDFALDAFEQALSHVPNAVRPRIEHCCAAPPHIQARMARLGVINSSAASFTYSLGDAYLRNRPKSDLPWLWPHRSMLDRGVLVCGHSDAPVCERNPFLGIWSMVSRRTESGQLIGPKQAISIQEALQCYTINPAIAERQFHIKGSLEPGKLADLIVLDRDLLTCPVDDIRFTQIYLTMVGGEVTYQCPTASWAEPLITKS